MNAVAEILPPLASEETTLAIYQPFRVTMAEFQAQEALLVFDYADKKGNEAARSHKRRLQEAKAAVEKARKAEKAESLAYGRKVDAQANEIIDAFDEMIAFHKSKLDEVEAAEQKRLARVHAAMEQIKAAPKIAFDATPEVITIAIEELEALVFDESFQGQLAAALVARGEALTTLRQHHAAAVQREAERAEIEKLRREAAEREERDRQELATHAERERQAAAAEQAKLEAEQAAARRESEAKEAEERRVREAEEAAAHEAERQRLAVEQAEKRAAEAVEQERLRVKHEAEAKAAEDARREANKRHQAKVHREIVEALARVGISEDAAVALIAAIRGGAVPHVTINY